MATPKVTPFPAGKQAPGLRHRVSPMTHLTPGELLSVLKAARARSARDWAMVLLAYRHGLRASEVCGLKLADMDLKTGSVALRRVLLGRPGSPQVGRSPRRLLGYTVRKRATA